MDWLTLGDGKVCEESKAEACKKGFMGRGELASLKFGRTVWVSQGWVEGLHC